jgi:hypothetical protein
MGEFGEMTVEPHADTPPVALFDFTTELPEHRFDRFRRNIGADRMREERVKDFSMFVIHETSPVIPSQNRACCGGGH